MLTKIDEGRAVVRRADDETPVEGGPTLLARLILQVMRDAQPPLIKQDLVNRGLSAGTLDNYLNKTDWPNGPLDRQREELAHVLRIPRRWVDEAADATINRNRGRRYELPDVTSAYVERPRLTTVRPSDLKRLSPEQMRVVAAVVDVLLTQADEQQATMEGLTLLEHSPRGDS